MVCNIDQWLEELNLSKYAALFAENEVDLEVLPDLTEQDLMDLGVPLGPRKKLLKAIAALSGGTMPEVQNLKPADITVPIHPEAERRQLTVLFCDLVGSTALSTQLDPEDMREIIRAYQAACSKVIGTYNGFLAKYMGDGVLAYFGYPQAHENDAERAARAGLGIVEAIAEMNIGHTTPRETELAVRVGIDTGLVVVGDLVGEGAAEEASVIGETPNIAARLQALAQPNQVVVGPLTRELSSEAFEFEDLGATHLKGIADPVQAWRVVSERDFDSRTEAGIVGRGLPLVGRQEELGLLLRSWDSSKRGHGQVVLVQGEGGIGKSRLIEALRAKLSSGDCLSVSIRCSPYHCNTTLYPVVEHLKRVAGWTPDNNVNERFEKLEAILKGQSLPLEDVMPLIAGLMSLPLPEARYASLQGSPQDQRERTLDALAGWLLEEAERRPVLCVWEDLHWADPTTLELLRLYIEQSPTVSMMNVLTYRPEFTPPWTARSHMTPITISRLEGPEIESLILNQTGGKALPGDVVEFIVGKSDGVPLYVEELTKAILEANFLREEPERYELIRPLSEVAIPATLQDSLMARLDRLPTIREVAQLGAVLGREFAYEMLEAIASLEEATLQKGLDQLVDAELLYQRGRGPRAKYIFKHALVQDAAYQSLLKRTRQYYHRQVAELLEARYPDMAQSAPEVLAHHYARAEVSEKAVSFLTCFAEKAAGMYAHAEAVLALQEALTHAERLPAEERDKPILDLALRQAESLHFLGRRREIVDLLVRHEERMEQLREPARAGLYYFWLGFAHAWLGHRAEAAQCLHRSLEEANRAGDEITKGKVHRALATECVYSGQPLHEAVAHGHESVSLLERTGDRLWYSQALFTLGYCCIFAGDFDSALEAMDRLESFGNMTGLRRARANAAMIAGLCRAMRGEGQAGMALCEQALELSPDAFETAFILACRGRACLEVGDTVSAVSALEEAVELADQVRSLQFRAWFRSMLGEAYLSNGNHEKAGQIGHEALEISTDIGFLIGCGLSQHLLGRIALIQNDLAKAANHLSEALKAFTFLGARFEMGRTRLDLSALAHAEGDLEGVAANLTEAHNLFKKLHIPIYAERANRLSTRFGISLPGQAAS